MENNDYNDEKIVYGSQNYDDNVFNIGNKQKRKCLCKIQLEDGFGIGFLCKIPFGTENNLLTVFIINNHAIDENYIYDVRIIIFTKENDPDYDYNICF